MKMAALWPALVLAILRPLCCPAQPQLPAQPQVNVQAFFRDDVGLTVEQITQLRNGTAIVKTMPSRTPAELFLFGAVFIHADPERYIAFAHDFERMRSMPNYLALGVFSEPPRLADLKGFAFDEQDIKSLRTCKPGDCQLQLPESSIAELQKSADWSAADVDDRMNQHLQVAALQFVAHYQQEGNSVLGMYHDKREATDVARQFAWMLSYSKAFPARLPAFYDYLLEYPRARPANVHDVFYWSKVKFGLKPTLRLVQLSTMRGGPESELAFAIAEKQLYSSHYFETALDLSFGIRGAAHESGFYLIMAMGSEQAGLTGVKGSIVRKAAVDRSLSSLRNALTTIRQNLEAEK
ncbi:MAG: hypothetical protein JO041_06360 [Acidobacteria bacterium]|nr:hypothetical protein [Acidobacteriota bacterium]